MSIILWILGILFLIVFLGAVAFYVAMCLITRKLIEMDLYPWE